MQTSIRATLSAASLLLAACGPSVDTSALLECPPGREQQGNRCEVQEIYFAGGTFTMGRGECFPESAHAAEFASGECELSDQPHEITVAPFYMDATELVIGDYEFFSDADACPGMEQNDACAGVNAFLALPMWSSEIDADAAVQWAEERCARFGKTVPTEAQWEYAATAGGTRLYPWGDDPPICGRVTAFDGQDGPCPFEPSVEVARYPPSPEGLYDLAGNFAEIVKPDPGVAPPGYPPLPVEQWPTMTWVGLRGGSLNEPSYTLRSARRGVIGGYRYPGLRCVRNP